MSTFVFFVTLQTVYTRPVVQNPRIVHFMCVSHSRCTHRLVLPLGTAKGKF